MLSGLRTRRRQVTDGTNRCQSTAKNHKPDKNQDDDNDQMCVAQDQARDRHPVTALPRPPNLAPCSVPEDDCQETAYEGTQEPRDDAEDKGSDSG